MPESGLGIVKWFSEASFTALVAFILYASYKRLWYWAHDVDELRKDKEFWKHMALELMQSNRTLVNVQEDTQRLDTQQRRRP